MPTFAELVQQGATHAWLFVPSAILLGVLHGLEPGHSKTMMAAFIVAIRGTVTQAVLLGVAATISHTIVVWGIALGGMYIWRGVNTDSFEPYFQIASAVLIIGIALWMLRRTWQERARAASGEHRHHDHHDHGHAHGEDIRRIDTGHGEIEIAIFEEGVPPVWRVRSKRGHHWAAQDVKVTIERPDDASQVFTFVDRGGYLESSDSILEPHEFVARVSLGHAGHSHDYDLSFVEDHEHGHDHIREELCGLDVSTGGFQDAHELAHANDIRRKFADQNVKPDRLSCSG